ncbi:SseB family protein [Paracoccus aurantiacus]|uniref:SseB family protein n=1 Tax=Paracoccus aurantiacus TaxID=2599412 RepID=A0A5C6S1U6_9RHOB|nr:SseB family protein [Paracoccus aurantiacus]TXB68559.1 SseB family protein [Paracoccus aurantiacus]
MTPLDALCETPFHELPDTARARVLNRLADTELFVALESDPVGDRAKLRLFDLPDGKLAIAADLEERLAGFFDAPTGHIAMPGRVLAAMLAAEDVTLMVNPGAGSEMLLGPGTLGWLADALSARPAEEQAGHARLFPPSQEMVARLAEPVATRLQDMSGLLTGAALVAAEWSDGSKGHLLVIEGADDDRRPVIAKAMAELFAFLPPLPQTCDVTFDLPLPAGALVLRPEPPAADNTPDSTGGPKAPGSDPDKPPILRF